MRSRMLLALSGVVLIGCAAEPEPVVEPVPMPDPTPIEYPVSLWDRGVQGETEVMVHVDQFGDVDSAMVSQSSGYPEFDSAAVTGARRLRFTPGKQGDRRVPMWTRMPVRFSQDSTASLGMSTGSGVRND